MNKRLSVLFLLTISLFLLVSAVSADDIADDSNAAIEVSSGEQSVDNSDDFTDALDLDNSLEANENSNGSYTYKIYVRTKCGHSNFTISETVYKKLEEHEQQVKAEIEAENVKKTTKKQTKKVTSTKKTEEKPTTKKVTEEVVRALEQN